MMTQKEKQMTRDTLIQHTASLEARIVKAASNRLGCVVEFVRWNVCATGDVPVLRVPASHMSAAEALGLVVLS